MGGMNHGASNLAGGSYAGAPNMGGGNGSNMGSSNHQNMGLNQGGYSEGGGYGYQPPYAGGSMTYTTGTYAGVNVMYTASGPVGYSGNVAIMYSTSPPQGGPPGGLVSPGGSLRDRRLPLLLSKQPPDGREGEEPTYVTVKAKK